MIGRIIDKSIESDPFDFTFDSQSSRRRKQDFSRGKRMQYVMMDLLVPPVFILTVLFVVSQMMQMTGV